MNVGEKSPILPNDGDINAFDRRTARLGHIRNGLALSLERNLSMESNKRNGFTLPFVKSVSLESKGKNGVRISRVSSLSPRRKFQSWGSPSRVSDTTVTRDKIMKGFELDFCWFCGRPMDGFMDKQSQRLLEYEHLLIQSQMDKMKMLDEQRKLKEKHEELLGRERKQRLEVEQRLHNEIDRRERIIQEKLQLYDIKRYKQARPLTCYLPVKDANFDLKHHIESAGHVLDGCVNDIHVTDKMCSGWLLKRGNKRKTWKRRWFVFNRKEKTLSYTRTKDDRKHLKRVYFQTIEEVYVDHLRTVKSPNSQLTFCVKTKERLFYLLAPSAETMRIWIDAIFTGAEGYQEFQ